MNDIRTILDRVLVEPEFNAALSVGGIFIGEGELQPQGKVLAVGPDVTDVKVGDTVVFATSSGIKTFVYAKNVLVFREHDLYGILEE